MKKLLIALLALVVLAVLGAAGAYVWVESRVETPVAAADETDVEFTVPKGTSARALGPLLEKQGLIEDARLWRWYLWRRGSLDAKAGRFLLKKSWPIPKLADALEQPPLAEDEPFVVVEGWRLRDTDEALAQKGLIRPGEYVKAASSSDGYTAPFPLPTKPGQTLEGYLYPETYRVVTKPFDVKALVQRQLDTFAQRVFLPNRAEVEKGKRSLHELVIMASMLEREEPVPEQRPLVAGILWKRIDRNFALGVDATSRYELAEWNDRAEFLKRLRDPADKWNTRTKVGLPPGPIGSPTESSFVAALRPTPSEFLYYLHDSQKRLHPSRNAEEHEALRKKYDVY